MKQIVTSYNVEFGYELLSTIPYAYWLNEQGLLEETISGKGSEALYYFSPKHTINPKPREWENLHYAFSTYNVKTPNFAIHKKYFDFDKFKIPPYKEHFANNKFKYNKPIVCICNRYNDEWGQPPINYFSLDCLSKMFELLKDKYQIIYWATDLPEHLQDSAKPLNLGDYNFVKKYFPYVKIFQDLLKKNKKYNWNTLQLMIFANCEKYITMNGGYTVLANYFGGQDIIYTKYGEHQTKELYTGAFWSYYPEFSNTQNVIVNDYSELYKKINQLYVQELPTVNILIRTCRRKNYFNDCIKSIKEQDYPNINIIVGIEKYDEFSFEYANNEKVRIVKYDNNFEIKKPPEKTSDYGIWFPFNSYLDNLTAKVGSGWIIYIDDDDCLLIPNAISKIVSQIKTNDDLILWRAKFPIDRLIPSDENWKKNPVVCDISGIGFCFHSQFKDKIKWGFWKRGDFRVAKKLYELCKSKKYINFAFTGVQDVPHSGQIIDKTMNIIKEIISENMTLVKVIVIKEKDGENKFANMGEIMTLEQSTADVLIRKGLVKVYNEKMKEQLTMEAEKKILEKALSEKESEDMTGEINPPVKNDNQAKEFKPEIETKELKRPIESKKAGRPKKK